MTTYQRYAALRRNVGTLLFVAGTSFAADRMDVPLGGDPERVVSALATGPAEARRILLVHGTPGSADGWEDLLDAVGPQWRWVAIDRPGFGLTRPTTAETRLSAQSEALEPFLPPAGEPGAILLGHSLGGAVVADAAARYPDRVGGIVIAAGALDPELERVYWLQRIGDSAGISWMLPRTLRNANRELIEFEAELRALAPRLARVRCPVVVVHGTEDGLVPYANVAYMERMLSHTELRVVRLEGANHFLPWQYRDVLLRAVASLVHLDFGE
jgi:pimeloyl-ACP methyl ester carboxylesterase